MKSYLSVAATVAAFAFSNSMAFASPSPHNTGGLSPIIAAGPGGIIYNTGDAATATLALGINEDGSLNTQPDITSNGNATGLAFKFPDGTWRDGTSPGCLCEGWGVSVNGTASGFADQDQGGANNLTADPLTAVTSSTVTSTTRLTSLPGLVMTHVYQPANNTKDLFRAQVTITNNTGAAVNDVKYVRVMDWDIPPTEFNEFVTIKGTTTTTLLERSHNDGFDSADPLVETSGIDATTEDVDFTDKGPDDHGAYFRFNFGTIEDGKSYTFNIFYGATASEEAALKAVGAESIELFSLGQSNGGEATGAPATYIFGFSGVGGTPIIPTATGIPTLHEWALLLMGLLLGGLVWRSARRNGRMAG